MAWSTPKFTIGGVPIEVPQALSLTCAYEELGGVATHRMGSGSAIRKAYWTRLKMVLSCEGQVPPGISDLDWTAPMAVQAPMPRSVYAASNVADLPANRRTDTNNKAYGLVDGFPQPTTYTVVGNTATAAPVANASGYVFEYYPEFTALVTKPESSERVNGTFSWTLTAEEV